MAACIADVQKQEADGNGNGEAVQHLDAALQSLLTQDKSDEEAFGATLRNGVHDGMGMYFKALQEVRALQQAQLTRSMARS